MKICLNQFIIMYFLCISFVLCAVSCDGRSIIPSRPYPEGPSWFRQKVNDPSSMFSNLFPVESSRPVPGFQYPLPSPQPSFFQIPGGSYPSIEYQPPSTQDSWSSWSQYQSPLTGGGSLSLSDLLNGGNSNIRLPSSFPRQPEIVITEYPRYDKYESAYPSLGGDLGFKPMAPLYNSGYGRASASAAASASSVPSSGGWGTYDSYDKPSFSVISGLRRNLGNDAENVNGGTKATAAAAAKSVSADDKASEDNSRRYLGTGDAKQSSDQQASAAVSSDNKSAAAATANAESAARRTLGNDNAQNAKDDDKSSAQQNDETPSNDKLEIETRLDFTAMDEDTTQNDKLEEKSQM